MRRTQDVKNKEKFRIRVVDKHMQERYTLFVDMSLKLGRLRI